MDHLDADVGGAASTKGGGTSKIGRKRIGSKAKRWGRRGRHSLQTWGRSTATDNRKYGEHDNVSTLGEPPPPLGGIWKGDLPPFQLEGGLQ